MSAETGLEPSRKANEQCRTRPTLRALAGRPSRVGRDVGAGSPAECGREATANGVASCGPAYAGRFIGPEHWLVPPLTE